MALDSKDLIFIYALSKMKTLDAAAQLLNKDSSSVFRAIKRIEKDIGQPIFTRSSKGFSTTDLSNRLSEQGEQIFTAQQAANQLLTQDSEALEGVLRITTTDYLLNLSLLPIIHQFSQCYPKVRFEFDASLNDDKLWERNNDIAIRPTNTPPQQMIGHHLSELHYRVVGSETYLENLKNPAHNPNIRWLLFNGTRKKHPTMKWYEQQITGQHNVAMFDSMYSLYQAIVSGYGVGIIPLLHPACQTASQTVPPTANQTLITLDDYSIEDRISLWMLYHPDNKKRALVKHFVRFALDNKKHFR